jgi:hypothetical protein
VSNDIEIRANALAEQLHARGAPASRAGVDRYITRNNPKLDSAAVLDHAVDRGWLVVSKDGLTVRPGATQPPPVVTTWSGLSR